MFGVRDYDGELRLAVRDDQFGDALYNFVQALLKVADVTFLSRERVRSTFAEDFRLSMAEIVPEERRSFDWHDERHDPEGKYRVYCRITDQTKEVFVYALQNDDQTRDATISLLQFEKWGVCLIDWWAS